MTLSLKNDVNISSKSNEKKKVFCLHLEINDEKSGSISSQRHGSTDPDPDPDHTKNVMDPQHW
jgi:hypothetical protein